MKIGYIGLGKMGKNMALRLLEQGIEVVAWNRSPEPLDEVVQAGAVRAEDLIDVVSKLSSNKSHPEPIRPEGSRPRRLDSGSMDSRLRGNDKRVIWLMLPAGEVIDQFINELSNLLSPGDLIIDGGNSYYKDTLRRAEVLNKKGIHFMDIGTSGGPKGAREGACLMVGGEKQDFEKVEEILKAVAAPNAYQHLGKAGAGHFAKMVHNGIEYGMMESIAEGAAILQKSDFNFNLANVFDSYNHRSVIESRLVGWTQEALKEDPDLKDVSPVIKSSGEGEWTIKTAKEIGIDAPAIEASFQVRQNSSKDEKNSSQGFRNKVVSALRGKFGGHEVKK